MIRDVGALLKLMARIEDVFPPEERASTVSSRRNGKEGWAQPGCVPFLEALHEKLHEISEKCKELECSLILESIHRLQEDVAAAKHSLGLISYDDMLGLVEKALYADNASVLMEKLRDRYRVAFIDEFQDTDPVQWRIFKRLFLEERWETSESSLSDRRSETGHLLLSGRGRVHLSGSQK